MFITSFVKFFVGGTLSPSPQLLVARAWPSKVRGDQAVRITARPAQAHLLVASRAHRAAAAQCNGLPQVGGARGFAVTHLRRAATWVACVAVRVTYAGNPLTPTGYAILAMTLVAVALVALLSGKSISSELESALWLGGLFS